MKKVIYLTLSVLAITAMSFRSASNGVVILPNGNYEVSTYGIINEGDAIILNDLTKASAGETTVLNESFALHAIKTKFVKHTNVVMNPEVTARVEAVNCIMEKYL